MKTSTIAPAVLACLMSLASTNAGPIPTSNPLSTRSIVRDIETEIIARAAELEARGETVSKENEKDSKALYSVGSSESESPNADLQTVTGGKGESGVDDPAAAGKGKKAGGKRDLSDFDLEARGGDDPAPYYKGYYRSGKRAGKRDLPDLELEAHRGRDGPPVYKGNHPTAHPAAYYKRTKADKRDLSDFELEVREALDARDLLEAELETRDFFESELEARDFFEAQLEARDLIGDLD